MGEVILQPATEDLLVAALEAQLPRVLGREVPGSVGIPNPRPAEFFRVLQIGGSWRNLAVWVPTIIVESWSDRGSRALELATAVDGLMHWFTELGGHAVYDVTEFAGPGNLPDPLTDQPRYTATYAVPIRAQGVELE